MRLPPGVTLLEQLDQEYKLTQGREVSRKWPDDAGPDDASGRHDLADNARGEEIADYFQVRGFRHCCYTLPVRCFLLGTRFVGHGTLARVWPPVDTCTGFW